MSELTVRALQNTVEFETGAVFTTEHTTRIDQLIRDGRLEEVNIHVEKPTGFAVDTDTLTGAAVLPADSGIASAEKAVADAQASESATAIEVLDAQYALKEARESAVDALAKVNSKLVGEKDDTPPAATESEDDGPAPERPRSSRTRKPKTDTE